jgi:hypothetical protein
MGRKALVECLRVNVRQKALFSVLSAICKLTQTALVYAVDLLADRASCESSVVFRGGHSAGCVAAHDGEMKEVDGGSGLMLSRQCRP